MPASQVLIIFISTFVLILSLKGLITTLTEFLTKAVGPSNVSNITCPNGTFKIGDMETCQTFLGCPEIKKDLMITEHTLGQGAQKIVMVGVWQEKRVAVSLLKHKEFIDDFKHGLNMLLLFDRSRSSHQANNFVQLIGWCFEEKPMIITEMHLFGDASFVHKTIKDNFPQLDTLSLRFKLCIDFVNILNILHTQPEGPRVMCDANDPKKALSQFLVTSNLSLILNDMDALPLVDKKAGQLVKCGHRELQSDFVAPEQRWPLDDEYDDEKMPHYDEKVDIWKIPDICDFLIGNIHGYNKLKLRLFNINSMCKHEHPQRRPTAENVLLVYRELYSRVKSR